MHNQSRMFALLVTAGALIGAVAPPAAAQGAGACPFASDTILTQTLGPSAQGQMIPGTGALCTVMGVTDTPIVLTHVTNAFPDGPPTADQLASRTPQFSGQGPNGSFEYTTLDGIGDLATFLSGTSSEGKSGAILTVVSGTDMYTFVMSNPPDNAQDMLTGLAKAVVANPSQ